jgi:hypothetical protein
MVKPPPLIDEPPSGTLRTVRCPASVKSEPTRGALRAALGLSCPERTKPPSAEGRPEEPLELPEAVPELIDPAAVPLLPEALAECPEEPVPPVEATPEEPVAVAVLAPSEPVEGPEEMPLEPTVTAPPEEPADAGPGAAQMPL